MSGCPMPREQGERVQRREVLLAGLCWPLLSLPGGNAQARETVRPAKAAATTAGPVPFGENTVADLARQLAAAPFRPQEQALPGSLAKIGYDQYRGIRFNPAKALWREQGLPFQAQFFHRAFLFRDRVDVHTVAGAMAQRLIYDPGQFTFDGAPAPTEKDLGFAGFRLHSPINRPDYFDEVCA